MPDHSDADFYFRNCDAFFPHSREMTRALREMVAKPGPSFAPTLTPQPIDPEALLDAVRRMSHDQRNELSLLLEESKARRFIIPAFSMDDVARDPGK